MKRFLCLTLTLLFLVLSLASCGEGGKGSNSTTKAPDNGIYTQLQAMANASYTNMIIDISSTQNNVTLKDHYVISSIGENVSVDYTCQRRSTFEDGVLPDSFITTYTGSLVTQDGKILSQNGDDVVIDFTTLSVNALVFDASYFSDVKEGEGTFEANVTNPAGFMNAGNLSVSDMTVNVSFGGAKTISISYTTANGSAVVIEYKLF